VFGGGNRQLLDHSVQQIVDVGFSIEEAEAALKANRNNVEKALRSLQKRGGAGGAGGAAGAGAQENGKVGGGHASGAGDPTPNGGPPPRDKAGARNRRGADKDKDDDGPPVSSAPKPSGRLSLRDFLENKLLLPPGEF